MPQVEYLLNFGSGYKKAGDPLNWKGLKLEALFTAGVDANPSKSNVYSFGKVKIGNLEWVAEEATALQKWRDDGVKGIGPGIYEAPGAIIRACGVDIFKGGIDLSSKSVLWECDKVVAPLRERGVETIMSLAESFDFNILFGNGTIKTTDYKWIPYAVSSIPNKTQLIMISLGIFIITNEIKNSIRELSERITKLAGELVATPFPAPGLLIAEILSLIIYFAYLILLFIRLIQLIKSFFDNIIQAKKWKLGMRVETLLRKGFEHLGYKFSSSIFSLGSDFYDTTIMPRKIVTPADGNIILASFKRPENEEMLNGNVYGYYDGVFGKLLREMMTMCNAEIVETNGTVYFEERNSFNNKSPYKIPNTDVNGYTHNLPDPHETNAEELDSYYALFYSLDETDRNTLNIYRGTSCDVTLSPKITNDKLNWSFKKSNIITFPYAHARRKETLTIVEEKLDELLNNVVGKTASIIFGAVLKNLMKRINIVMNTLPSSQPKPSLTNFNFAQLQNVFKDRYGWLMLSQDTAGIQKIFIGQPITNSFNPPNHPSANGTDWEIHPDSEKIMAAVNIMRKFHKKNLATQGNQYRIYRNKTIKFCCDDWNQTRGVNILQTSDGKEGKFEKIDWDLYNEQAMVDYRVKRLFTNNLKEIAHEDGQPKIIIL